MHSSRMRTTCSSSCWGGLLQCMLGYTPLVWAWRPLLARPLNLLPGCGPGDPLRPDPSTSPLGVGLETPPARPLKLHPGCGPGNLQGMLGYTPGDLQDMLGYHLQGMLGYHPTSPPCEQNHRHV